MRKKLISYINTLFARAPKSAQAREIHDEILLNTLDRFDEELSLGRSEEEAYAAAVAGIGNIDEVLEPLYPQKVVMTVQRVIAIALYVCCVVPVIFGSMFGETGASIGVCVMFFLVALATYLMLTAALTPKTRRMKQLRALGIALYIVCVTPTIFFSRIVAGELGEIIGVCLMFLLAAAATALVIYPSGRLRRREAKSTPAPDCAAADEKTPMPLAWRIFVPVYWVGVACVFSFLGSYVLQWYFAWLIFPIAGALFSMIHGIFDLTRGECSTKRFLSSALWLLITVAYLILTIETNALQVTWLVFPIGAAISGVIGAIYDLIYKGENAK